MEINNKKAYFDYEILETYEAGIVLTGTEIKSIRLSNVNLKDSYAHVKNNEVFLLNMHISEYKEGNIFNHNETRTRKLLLHKKEIRKLKQKIQEKGFTIVCTKVYLKKGRVKLEIALAKGKKLYDKRESIKERDLKMEARKAEKY